MTAMLRGPRLVALVAIAALVTASAAASFTESYRALYLWAVHHGVPGGWAAVWPLQVDTFIAVGELALFVGLADRWLRRSRASAWAVTLVGLAVSVAANVGHVATANPWDRATAAVPPVAAAAALAVGLGVLKRVVATHPGMAPDLAHDAAQTPLAVPATVPAQAPPAAPGKPVQRRSHRTASSAMNRKVARASEAYKAALASGGPPSERALAEEFKIGRRRAATVVRTVRDEAGNGHHDQVGELVAAP